MPRIALIQIPYDSGRYNARMGAGPGALMNRGLADHLRLHHEVDVFDTRLPDGFHTEASALVALQCAATSVARDAIERGARPIILSGNCGPAALSAIAALCADQTGVVWFDAHADCNTPETSPSGFLDGMGVAILTGQCWPKLTPRFDGFTPIRSEQIIQVGVRQVDPGEKSLLESLKIERIGSDQLNQLPEALTRLMTRINRLYLHLDADVLDISEGAANAYACPGGLNREQLNDCLRLIADTGALGAASLTSYDPASDANCRIADALLEAAAILAN